MLEFVKKNYYPYLSITNRFSFYYPHKNYRHLLIFLKYYLLQMVFYYYFNRIDLLKFVQISLNKFGTLLSIAGYCQSIGTYPRPK